MGNNRKWLVPDYFDSFSCKCGSCRNACCKGWKIAVTQEEYYRLIDLECSETLHEKIESAFVKISVLRISLLTLYLTGEDNAVCSEMTGCAWCKRNAERK